MTKRGSTPTFAPAPALGDLDAIVRSLILPLAEGLYLVPSIHDQHITFCRMFERVYPVVGQYRDVHGYTPCDLPEACRDSAFTIPLITLQVMEACIQSVATLPAHTREAFHSTCEIVRFRIDPWPLDQKPEPPRLWKDDWMRAFDYLLTSLSLPYLTRWSPPQPVVRKGKRSRPDVLVDSGEIQRRDDLLIEWKHLQRQEIQDRLWTSGLRGQPHPASIEFLCLKYKIDSSDLRRWHRGELAIGSRTSVRIECALGETPSLDLPDLE